MKEHPISNEKLSTSDQVLSKKFSENARAFFEYKIPPERKAEAQKEAEAYDARELEHVHALDKELTGERLIQLAKQEQEENIRLAANTLQNPAPNTFRK